MNSTKDIGSRVKFLKTRCVELSDDIKEIENVLDKITTSTEREYFEARYKLLHDEFSSLDNIIAELTSLDEDNSDEYRKTRTDLRERYFTISVKRNELIGSNTSSAQNSINELNRNSPGVLALPAPLPQFDGNVEQWIEFKKNFRSRMEKMKISDSEKLSYLRSSLSGEALYKIFHLEEDIDANYEVAWNILCQAYENKRLLITTHALAIIGPYKMKADDPKELIKLRDTFVQHAEALKSLGIIIPEEILVLLFETKLDSATVEAWDKTIRGDKFPTFKELYNFDQDKFNRSNERLAIRKRLGDKLHDVTPNKVLRTSETRTPKSQVFVTNDNKCFACSKLSHGLYKCQKFIEFDIDQRFQVVKSNFLCYNCLQKHERFHHTLLHEKFTDKSVDKVQS